MTLKKFYKYIESEYLKGNYCQVIHKQTPFEKYFPSGKQEKIKDIQTEVEKYILYLWGHEHKIKSTNSNFKYVYIVNNMIDDSFLKKVTFNELLKFISPQTEIV